MGFTGAKLVKTLWPQQVSLLFVMPPSIDELYQRLKHRGTDDEELGIRLDRNRVYHELALAEMADVVIKNGDHDQAFDKLCSYLRAIQRFGGYA